MDKPQLRSWQPAIFVLCYCPNTPKELSNSLPTKPCLWFWFKGCRKGSQYKGISSLPLQILHLLWGGTQKVVQKDQKAPTYNIFKNHSEWTITRATWSYSIQLDGRSILTCGMKEEVQFPESYSKPRDISITFSRNTSSTPWICGQNNCQWYNWGNVFSSWEKRASKGRSTKYFPGKQWPVLQIFIIKNPLQFSLVIDCLRIGVSLRMVVFILLRTKEHTGLASVGSISEKKVRSHAGFVCAINLQQIKKLLESFGTFSVAMDMASHMSSS